LPNDAERLGAALRERGLHCATAESCTGGSIASMITDVAGSSDYFTVGIVAYAEEQKQRLLGVSKETLDRFSAVSKETCCEMLAGIKRVSRADLCIATTGYAGPSGGTASDPVGTVYIGVGLGDRVCVERLVFRGTRAEVKVQASTHALAQALRSLSA